MSGVVCFMSFHSLIWFFLPDTDVFVTLLRYFVCCVSHAFQILSELNGEKILIHCRQSSCLPMTLSFTYVFDNAMSPDCLQSCLSAISAWSDHWQLKLAPLKCSVVHVNSTTVPIEILTRTIHTVSDNTLC